MIRRICDKCFNYETVSYVICGVLTTLVDFLTYTAARGAGVDVALAQAMSGAVAILFAYVVNKLIVFRNFNYRPAYLAREMGSFVAARIFSWVLTWAMMVGMVWLGGDSSFTYELFCKAVVSAVSLVLNYVFSKLWIFKKTTSEER